MATMAAITDDLAVAWQLQESDFAWLAEQGFRTVINNRPDNEPGGAYISAVESERLASAHGLTYAHLPVTHANLADPDLADAFRALIDELPKPILAYCRTGTRCTLLWSLAAVSDNGIDDVVQKAGAAGYDISVLIPDLEQRLRERRNGGASAALGEVGSGPYVAAR